MDFLGTFFYHNDALGEELGHCACILSDLSTKHTNMVLGEELDFLSLLRLNMRKYLFWNYYKTVGHSISVYRKSKPSREQDKKNDPWVKKKPKKIPRQKSILTWLRSMSI